MNISPEQLQQHKNSLQLTVAEIELQERELEAWKARGEAERNLYSWIADISADPAVKRTPLRAYHDAHKAHYAAQGDLKELAIAKLKSTAMILQTIVNEAERLVKEGKAGLVTTH
jgi:hypothetical protein